MLADPGEVRLLALAQAGDGIHQHRGGRPRPETTHFAEGQAPLHPAVALGTYRPLGPFAPQDAKPSGPFRPVVGRLDTMRGEKDPQGIHRPQQAAGKPPRLLRAVRILVAQLTELGLPRLPRPTRGGGRGHRAETLQLGERPGSW